MIVHSLEPILLIGGAPVDADLLARVIKTTQTVVAADSGADQALKHGLTPDAVIGDMDSIALKTRDVIPDKTIHHITEQDSTDFEKCLRNISAPITIGMGFTGGQLDHHLAVCAALVKHPQNRCVLADPGGCMFVLPPKFEVDLPVETTVSLFPMGPVQGQSSGLKWPIEGLKFAPDGQIGTSNQATGPVKLQVDAPKMLIILPIEHLKNALAALNLAPTWMEN